MDKLLDLGSNVVGGLGISICLVAGIVRLTGAYHLMGFEAVTLFIGGTALMVAGCFAKLQLLTMGR